MNVEPRMIRQSLDPFSPEVGVENDSVAGIEKMFFRSIRSSCRLITVAAVVALVSVTSVHAVTYPLKVNSGGRYLEDQTGTPVLINGDAAWSLMAQLTYSETQTYLTDRANRGFNGVIVNLIEHYFATHAPANIAGIAPFTGATFTTPNEAYFTHADSVIALANQLGITVFLFPIYLGNPYEQGWYNEVSAASYATMKSWGTYVGNRYKSYPNIVWVIGGDVNPEGVQPKLDSMVVALRAADNTYPNRLMTAHNQRGTLGTSYWTRSWMTLNNTYTSLTSLVYLSDAAYDLTPVLPYILSESYYENEYSMTTQQLRAQAYWTILRGGCGHIFGNCPIWGLGAAQTGCGTTNWQSALGAAGSISMTNFRNLFTSRHWYKLVPDRNGTVLTSGASSGTSLATAAYASDSTVVIAYLPTQRAVTINSAVLAGDSIHVRWYEPGSGTYTDIGTLSKASRSYTPPDVGDWVLVIDGKASSTGCCAGTTGNVNLTGIVDLSDLSALVSYLTGGGYVLPCYDEANVNASSIVDLSDLSALVSYLTGGGYVLPNCP